MLRAECVECPAKSGEYYAKTDSNGKVTITSAFCKKCAKSLDPGFEPATKKDWARYGEQRR